MEWNPHEMRNYKISISIIPMQLIKFVKLFLILTWVIRLSKEQDRNRNFQILNQSYAKILN